MGSAHDQAKVWAVGATVWAEQFEPHLNPLWHQMLAMGGVTTGKKFLDAGCGAGGASVLAHAKGAHVTGVDATPELLAIAKQRLPQARFDIADLEELPFTGEKFDVIFAANAVQFTYDPGKALTEFKRVLAPHGRAVVAVFTDAQRNALGKVFGAMFALSPEKPRVGPFALGKPGLLEAAIEASGLELARDEEIPLDFVYPNLETMWQIMRAAGPVQNLIALVGEEKVHAAIINAAQEYVRPGGEVHLVNRSHVVTLAA